MTLVDSTTTTIYRVQCCGRCEREYRFRGYVTTGPSKSKDRGRCPHCEKINLGQDVRAQGVSP